MKKDQALQLLAALYEERVLGVIGENEITQLENPALIRAIKVADPSFPHGYLVAPNTQAPNPLQKMARRQVAEFLKRWAAAIEAEE